MYKNNLVCIPSELTSKIILAQHSCEGHLSDAKTDAPSQIPNFVLFCAISCAGSKHCKNIAERLKGQVLFVVFIAVMDFMKGWDNMSEEELCRFHLRGLTPTTVCLDEAIRLGAGTVFHLCAEFRSPYDWRCPCVHCQYRVRKARLEMIPTRGAAEGAGARHSGNPTGPTVHTLNKKDWISVLDR